MKEKTRNALIISMAYFSTLRRRRKPSRIISLHDIPRKSQGDFEAKMLWLKQNYNIVSLEDIYEQNDKLEDNSLNVALTFDDGFKEHAAFVAPILNRLCMPATFFIPSGSIGAPSEFGSKNLHRHGTFEFIDKAGVKIIADNPLFRIGGHTMSHADLGPSLTIDRLVSEIQEDKKNIENLIGKKIKFFAYPFGGVKNISANSISMIKSAGYLAALTIVPSFWRSDKNLYTAGRDSLSVNDPVYLWKAWLRGGYDIMSRIKNFL